MILTTEFDCTPTVRDYIYRIADEMILAFNISTEEAAGRINRQWKGKSFVKQADEEVLLHRDPEHWAKEIYFGHVGLWMSRVHGPQPPLPWP